MNTFTTLQLFTCAMVRRRNEGHGGVRPTIVVRVEGDPDERVIVAKRIEAMLNFEESHETPSSKVRARNLADAFFETMTVLIGESESLKTARDVVIYVIERNSIRDSIDSSVTLHR